MKSREAKYLLDVNVLLALMSENHIHHRLAMTWFTDSEREWALCAFTESGFIRNAIAPRLGQITMIEATAILERLMEHPGYRYVPISADWRTLCGPFFPRLYGSKQVTDAYLLGLAVREGLVLVTMDKAIVHLAGERYRESVLLLA